MTTTPSSSGHAIADIAAALQAVLENNEGPYAIDSAFYADEILITRNAVMRFQVGPDALVQLSAGRHRAMEKAVPDLRYVDIWVGATADAVVTRWTMNGTLPDGTPLTIPHCSIFHVRDGRIVAQDLFSDSAADQTLAPLVFSQEGQNMDPALDAGVTVIETGAAAAAPVVAQKSPIAVTVEPGRVYWWCSCGRSKKQPFCDASHAGTGLAPLKFVGTEARTLYFCACKNTANAPFCDASHKAL